MTANFQSFSVPFDSKVSPVYPGSIINDEFRSKVPDLVLSVPPRYVAALDPKWVTFAPGGGLIAAWIDPQREMMILSGTPEKKWAGKMQNLPLPAVGEENAIGYTLVTRVLNAVTFTSGNDGYGPIQLGMLLGEDFEGDPETSQLWAVYQELTRSGSVLTGLSGSASAIAYDAPLTVDGHAVSASNPPQFLAARVETVQPTAGVYESDIALLTSADGIFFQELYRYADLTVPIRQVALAQRAETTTSLLTAVDFLRFYPLVPGDAEIDLIVGQTLQLGSV